MTENKKNVLLVCDMPGYGKVATAVMMPILSYMGHPTYNIPTMLISNTFEYGRFEQLETTDYIVGTLKTWKKLGFKFDAVATGYMPSATSAARSRSRWPNRPLTSGLRPARSWTL